MKDEIKKIKDKLVNFDFETDCYKDLNFISEITQDLKELIEEKPKSWLIERVGNLALCYKTFIRQRSRKKGYRNMCF